MSSNEQALSGPEMAAGAPYGLPRGGYSVREFAAMFGISQWNVRLAVKERQIDTLRFGRRLIIPASEVKRLAGVDIGAN